MSLSIMDFYLRKDSTKRLEYYYKRCGGTILHYFLQPIKNIDKSIKDFKETLDREIWFDIKKTNIGEDFLKEVEYGYRMLFLLQDIKEEYELELLKNKNELSLKKI